LDISTSDVLLLAHAACGITGCMAALWVFVEALNARPANARRTRIGAIAAAACMTGAWICGGYWYVHFYPAEKAMILEGPWPFAHNLFMETKEHLFFVTAILSFLLTIATTEELYSCPAARKLALSVAGLIVTTGLAVEGAGAVINHGVKIALLRDASTRSK
jgi:hypothetical protein